MTDDDLRACRACGARPAVVRGWCMSCYKRARRGTLPDPGAPKVGDRDGYGRYGVLDRDDATVLCHECGRRLMSLGYHLRATHGMTAAEYRVAHGLPRTLGLQSLGLLELRSRQGQELVGGPGWGRLEAARDPLAASAARVPESMRVAPGSMVAKAETSRANVPRRERRWRTCPVCGTQHQRRKDSCGAPACVSKLRAEAAARAHRQAHRPLTESEHAVLLAATESTLPAVVRSLQDGGVRSAEIGDVLGRSVSWMSKHYPTRKRS